MAYTKTNWQDLPNTTTPITASRLNNIEDGIKTNDDKLLGNTSMGNITVSDITISSRSFITANSSTYIQGNDGDIPTKKGLQNWNGAYDSSNNSNLEYSKNGSIAVNEDKGCAIYKVDQAFTQSQTAWSRAQIDLNTNGTFTTSNTNFEKNGNGIKCNFNGWILVNGYIGNNYNGEFDAGIYKNSSVEILPINLLGRCSSASCVIQVSSGDTIYLVMNTAATGPQIQGGTYLIVQRVI